jgi:excisionase family DNA binding protein
MELTKQQDEIPEFITISDAAEKLGVSERTMIRWVQKGILPVFKIKNITRITRKDFRNFIKSNMTSASIRYEERGEL